MLNVGRFCANSVISGILVSTPFGPINAFEKLRKNGPKSANRPEQLRCGSFLPRIYPATLVDRLLTISDISDAGDDNSLSVTTTEIDLIIAIKSAISFRPSRRHSVR